MSKKVKITAAAIMACVFVTSAVLFVISEINNDIIDAAEPQIVSAEFGGGEDYTGAVDTAASDAVAEVSPLDDGRYYVLRDADGYLGIFSSADASMPELITAVRTESLRNADIERIKAGITVKGFENLLKLLEDFSS